MTPEYRFCPMTGRWVVIAPERAGRPMTLSHGHPHTRDANTGKECPFCEGNEQSTPGERLAIRTEQSQPNGPGWQLRVVPNKYPAVRSQLPTEFPPNQGPLFQARPGVGQHELVIPCSRHVSNPTELSDHEFRDMLMAYRSRIQHHADDPQTKYVSVFQNVGAEAGASISHVHSQIVTMPMVPDSVQQELDQSAEYYSRSNHCVFCDVLRDEFASRQRIVSETDRFVAITPFAARFAYECWVLPKKHVSQYETLDPESAFELSLLIKDVSTRLDAVLDHPSYNSFLHTSPTTQNDPLPYYHWHIEIVPRIARPAGFEWGTGCFINTTAPERAAMELRNAARKIA